MPIKNILVAVDGSSGADKTLAQVVDLVSNYAVKPVLHPVCVANIPLGQTGGAPVYKVVDENAQKVVDEAVAFFSAHGLNANGHIADGMPARALVEASKELNCDIIYIGHRHMSLLGRMFEPSVCVELLNLTSTPVTVLPD